MFGLAFTVSLVRHHIFGAAFYYITQSQFKYNVTYVSYSKPNSKEKMWARRASWEDRKSTPRSVITGLAQFQQFSDAYQPVTDDA